MVIAFGLPASPATADEFTFSGMVRNAKNIPPIKRGTLQLIEPNPSDDPGLAFDRQWATTVLNEAIERLRALCTNDGLAAQWSVFDQRVLTPSRQGNAPAPVDEMMKELGATTPQEVYSMVQTMKRRLQRELLMVVRETVYDPAEAEAELAELLRILARPRSTV